MIIKNWRNLRFIFLGFIFCIMFKFIFWMNFWVKVIKRFFNIGFFCFMVNIDELRR